MRHPVEGVTKMNALTLAALVRLYLLMTAAGAAVVFLFKNEIKPRSSVCSGVCRRRDDRGQCVEPADPLH